MTPAPFSLPVGLTVLERGWLSSNNILDSGHASHADQPLRLVESALDGRPPNLLLNTHCTATTAAAMPPCSPATDRSKPGFPPGRPLTPRTGVPMLEWQRIGLAELATWARQTAYFRLLHARWRPDITLAQWAEELTAQLVRAGAAAQVEGHLINI